MMVIRDRGTKGWRILAGIEGQRATVEATARDVSTDGAVALAVAGQKRPRRQETGDDDVSTEPPAKKLRTESSSRNGTTSCKIPSPSPVALTIFAELDRIASAGTALADGELPAIESTGDVFLTQGWRERWCRCSTVCSLFKLLVIG
jgi:E3 ubiquitin-protein ligase UBR7